MNDSENFLKSLKSSNFYVMLFRAFLFIICMTLLSYSAGLFPFHLQRYCLSGGNLPNVLAGESAAAFPKHCMFSLKSCASMAALKKKCLIGVCHLHIYIKKYTSVTTNHIQTQNAPFVCRVYCFQFTVAGKLQTGPHIAACISPCKSSGDRCCC